MSNASNITDIAGNEFAGGLPDQGTTLVTSKSISFDTIKPTIIKITSTTPNGYYRKNTQVSIQVEFSEVVYVEGVPELSFNFIPTKASYSNGNGSKVLIFNYTVAEGDNTGENPLYVKTLTGVIKDVAKNDCLNAIPSSNLSGIRIDTEIPEKPSIIGVENNKRYATNQMLTFSKLELNANYRYAINGVWQGDWLSIPSLPRKLEVGGDSGSYKEYAVKVQQRDRAGNESVESDELTFVIDKDSPNLVSITTTTPSGIMGQALCAI